MSTTWVKETKSELDGVIRFREYLYNGNATDELVDIYEQVTDEVEELEDELYKLEYLEKEEFEDEYKEMKEGIEQLIKDFKKLKRDEILEELKRIVF